MHSKLHRVENTCIWVTDVSLKLNHLRREIHYKVGIGDTIQIVL